MRSPTDEASRASARYFSTTCWALPRTLTSGPLLSKVCDRECGFLRPVRPRRRFGLDPCLMGPTSLFRQMSIPKALRRAALHRSGVFRPGRRASGVRLVVACSPSPWLAALPVFQARPQAPTFQLLSRWPRVDQPRHAKPRQRMIPARSVSRTNRSRLLAAMTASTARSWPAPISRKAPPPGARRRAIAGASRR